MDKASITLRTARCDDAPLIARVVAMAIGDEQALRSYCGEEYLTVLASIASHTDTQYGWPNALVAEVDGVAVGAAVGYEGAQLATLREGTFAVLRERIGRTPTIADETEVGEYYLDSIAVEPSFRGLGVGRALIEGFCQRAFAEGHERVGLIVDCDNPSAESLYAALGFRTVGERLFFGHRMRHMQREKR